MTIFLSQESDHALHVADVTGMMPLHHVCKQAGYCFESVRAVFDAYPSAAVMFTYVDLLSHLIIVFRASAASMVRILYIFWRNIMGMRTIL